MVHALHEAQRVLKPDGRLIDLRPMHIHRRVGISQAGIHHQIGIMREKFDDDLAADRAVAQVRREGSFKLEERIQFNCNRVMDTFKEFKDWLTEFTVLKDMPSHEWLLDKVNRALMEKPGKFKIVCSIPLKLQVLRKQAES
jgi:hypothetical protein